MTEELRDWGMFLNFYKAFHQTDHVQVLGNGDKLLCQTQIKAVLAFKVKKAEEGSIALKIPIKSEKRKKNGIYRMVNNSVKN